MVRKYIHSLMVRYYIHLIHYRFKYTFERNGIKLNEKGCLLKRGQIVRLEIGKWWGCRGS